MTSSTQVAEKRRALLAQLCPKGPVTLWCPLLTHYRADGGVDEDRLLAHLDHVAAWVTGILVPGSTGDGWELSEAERLRVLGLVLDQATRLKLQVLVGVLKTDASAVLASLVGTVEWLKHRTGEANTLHCLVRRRVGAFTLCAPSGAGLSQGDLRAALATLLDTGLPMALYQLPQVTGNRLEPETVRELAERYANLLFFTDSSGEDLVATAVPQPPGLCFLRGAEGDYVASLRGGGGPYDGLLLSSANAFPREIRHMMRDLERKRMTDAVALSDRLGRAVRRRSTISWRSALGEGRWRRRWSTADVVCRQSCCRVRARSSVRMVSCPKRDTWTNVESSGVSWDGAPVGFTGGATGFVGQDTFLGGAAAAPFLAFDFFLFRSASVGRLGQSGYLEDWDLTWMPEGRWSRSTQVAVLFTF